VQCPYCAHENNDENTFCVKCVKNMKKLEPQPEHKDTKAQLHVDAEAAALQKEQEAQLKDYKLMYGITILLLFDFARHAFNNLAQISLSAPVADTIFSIALAASSVLIVVAGASKNRYFKQMVIVQQSLLLLVNIVFAIILVTNAGNYLFFEKLFTELVVSILSSIIILIYVSLAKNIKHYYGKENCRSENPILFRMLLACTVVVAVTVFL